MQKKFPQYLSQPFQVLWFESDDIVLFLLSIVVAHATGGVFWLLPIVSPILSTRIKRNFPRGYGKHVLYFLGILKIKGSPDAFVKEFSE